MYTGTTMVEESYEQHFMYLYCKVLNDPSKEVRDYIITHFNELMEGYKKKE